MGEGKQPCDLVMEGGGVKGIGLVGALSVLRGEGYDFCRIAGTSAGAIVGSLAAAGMPIEKLETLLETFDYRSFRDEGMLDRFGLPGKTASLVFEKGIYEGKHLHSWLSGQLEALGVTTFADLKLTDDWAMQLPEEQRYSLVVIVSDITRGQLVRFPWDYHLYGLDPDTQLVADAVRASASIPFFFEPVKLNGNLLVDGGLQSNFPISLFDSTSQWPTFGIKLSAKEVATSLRPVSNIVDFIQALADTAMHGHDRMHLDDPCVTARTIFVDANDIKGTDFDITREEQELLYRNGQTAAKKFLKNWDFAAFQKMCPSRS